MEPERLQSEHLQPEHRGASDPSPEVPPLRVEREHLPDGRAITYYSRADEPERAVGPEPA